MNTRLPFDPHGSLDAALHATISHFRAETGTIHVVENGLLVLKAIVGAFPPPVMDAIRSIPVGKGMAGLAAQRRAPVTACNIQTDASGDVRPGARATGMEGAIVVPMIDAKEELRGTLGIANRAARDWSTAEANELIAFGRAIAEAIVQRA
ncbi:MAG: GAF domain-containing protein [Phycisphaerales bacterium]